MEFQLRRARWRYWRNCTKSRCLNRCWSRLHWHLRFNRQPGKKGSIPSVIVRFARRNVKDDFYQNWRHLAKHTTASLGYTTSNKVYMNENLTSNVRKLHYEVRQFQRNHHYKFCWSRYGKIFLKKDTNSDTVSFTNLQEFDKFSIGHRK